MAADQLVLYSLLRRSAVCSISISIFILFVLFNLGVGCLYVSAGRTQIQDPGDPREPEPDYGKTTTTDVLSPDLYLTAKRQRQLCCRYPRALVAPPQSFSSQLDIDARCSPYPPSPSSLSSFPPLRPSLPIRPIPTKHTSVREGTTVCNAGMHRITDVGWM